MPFVSVSLCVSWTSVSHGGAESMSGLIRRGQCPWLAGSGWELRACVQVSGCLTQARPPLSAQATPGCQTSFVCI